MSNLSESTSSFQPAGYRYRRRRASTERGIPKSCRCGQEAIIKTSGTVRNPGRLFYCCPYGSEGDKYHLFTWVDERVTEEVEDLKLAVDELQRQMSDTQCNLAGLVRKLEQSKLMIDSSNNRNGCCVIM